MLIKNARLSDGSLVDLLLEEGKITGILQNASAEGHQVLDAKGRTVLPGLIDLHCHWRVPGQEHKEDVITGSAAAAAGGYTFVTLMPNTSPVCSSAEQANQVMEQVERHGVCSALQTVSITQNFDGKTLDHLKPLPEHLRFITEDGKGVQNNQVMARAFAICAQRNLVLMSHAEDMEISKWDYRLAENLETVRNLHLSEYYGTRLHLCHVSTKEAVEAIGAAKRKGVPVTCEVTPHHLWFADLDYRVNPPIRTQQDVDALVQAIREGVVDAIATDHAPHTQEEKAAGAAGMIGLETAFGVCYTKLCKQQGLELYYLEALMSRFPAAILGLQDKGAIRVGADADLILVDLDTPYQVEPDKMHSKSRNTPFAGETLYGRVDYTIKAGKLVFER
ncbi:MAG: dihydroorotase [Candidatus Fournierella pullistercoris]|uniref:Dihydroorotase n=1 Tax=Candidatus Allofournierella pullistercoris TaxID=2838597 RepID=A0A948T3K6_9FIRM|nr:dihydroorotase [Candidatus Fournierella pullistercoris]